MTATPAIPGAALPGLLRPGDPVTSAGGAVAASSISSVGRTGISSGAQVLFTSVPGRASPGLFLPGSPGASFGGSTPAIGTAAVSAAAVSASAVKSG